MTITIIPAGSNSGRSCVEAIKRDNLFPSTEIRNCSRTFQADYGENFVGIDCSDKLALQKAFKDTKYAFIVTPHGKSFDEDRINTLNMINEAHNAGVEFIVLVGSWTVHQPELLSELAHRFLEPEALLKKLESKGLKWTVLRGGFFTMNIEGMWAKAIKSGSNATMIRQFLAPVDTRDIGECAAKIFSDGPDKHHGKCYEMNGPDLLSSEEIHEAVQKGSGKQFPLTIVPASSFKGSYFMKQMLTYLENGGKNATPFSQDVGNLIGDKWTTVEKYFAERKKIFQ